MFCFHFVFILFLAAIEYLNGKLDDGTKYAVFQRSFDKDGNYEDEGFIEFTTNKDDTAAIVTGVVVAILAVVAIVIVVIIFYRRRKNRDGGSDGEDVPMNSKPHRRRTGSKSVSNYFRRSGIGKLLYILMMRLFIL